MKKTNQITRVSTNFVSITGVNVSVNEDYTEIIFLDTINPYGGLVFINIDYDTKAVTTKYFNGYSVSSFYPCDIRLNYDTYIRIKAIGSTLYILERFYNESYN